ncbi:MAG: glutathione S-transferase family protein [Paracoccaceae bacterium]|uniref:glutathione S-transferase family protein n=1 Tax=Seohaeicola saemankumensis TaxID=481181 RepID=UPI001E512142|nr:glutathione S-transferase family protein [Seohaeicola saemankumensis]
MAQMTLYSMPSSGNSYKVRLLLSLQGKDYMHIPCEYGTEALTQAKATGKAPLDKFPVLHLPDGRILNESNAILWYLGAGTDWVPTDPFAQAQMLSWMFFEQNRHESVIAVRAALLCYPERAHLATPERLAALLEDGNVILKLMEDALVGRNWFCGASPTLADIALYGYTCTADTRGGYDMTGFPRITTWCARMASLPGYVTLDHLP